MAAANADAASAKCKAAADEGVAKNPAPKKSRMMACLEEVDDSDEES